jgi:agmatinase
MGVREAFFAQGWKYPKEVLDLGDVVTIPQLLDDSMLQQSQIEACQKALYPNGFEKGFPVSPLSVLKGAVSAIYELNPRAKIALIGGDHSVSWPPVDVLASHHSRLAILHFDAHTDMLAHRFGIENCFATWAYQACKRIPPNHLVQVGIRTSSHPKQHWTSEYPIRQYWAEEIQTREKEVTAEITAYFESLGALGVYISNDIDGTDAALAPATGTPEKNGLAPEFVQALIRSVASVTPVLGGDIVEVAPILSGTMDFGTEPTCVIAAYYFKTLLNTLLTT